MNSDELHDRVLRTLPVIEHRLQSIEHQMRDERDGRRRFAIGVAVAVSVPIVQMAINLTEALG